MLFTALVEKELIIFEVEGLGILVDLSFLFDIVKKLPSRILSNATNILLTFKRKLMLLN